MIQLQNLYTKHSISLLSLDFLYSWLYSNKFALSSRMFSSTISTNINDYTKYPDYLQTLKHLALPKLNETSFHSLSDEYEGNRR
ncbi:hypothetical protein Hanom_Chr15g01373241 [Helianthus anomalus]